MTGRQMIVKQLINDYSCFSMYKLKGYPTLKGSRFKVMKSIGLLHSALENLEGVLWSGTPGYRKNIPALKEIMCDLNNIAAIVQANCDTDISDTLTTLYHKILILDGCCCMVDENDK